MVPIWRALVYLKRIKSYATSIHFDTLFDIGQFNNYWLTSRPNSDMHSLKNIQPPSLRPLFDHYQLNLKEVDINNDIPYSFWGAPEAGRFQSTLYAREDTPIHSLLHEACHFICMSPQQRHADSHDAGGSALIENACCFLQLVLSDHIPNFNLAIHMHDMNTWGYNFRLGSVARWFYADSDDASQWLIRQKIIDNQFQPTWQLRSQP